jgi:photosystem I subunit 4
LKRILWFNQIGTVAVVDQSGSLSCSCSFENVNYSGTNTNNFAIDELEVKQEIKVPIILFKLLNTKYYKTIKICNDKLLALFYSYNFHKINL